MRELTILKVENGFIIIDGSNQNSYPRKQWVASDVTSLYTVLKSIYKSEEKK